MKRKCEKFGLLMWKNFIIQIRHPVQTVFEILVPVLIVIILVVARKFSKPEHHPDTYFPEVDIRNAEIFTMKKEIAYSPENPSLRKILEKVAVGLNIPTVRGHNNSGHLLNNLKEKEREYTFGAIQFSDDLYGEKELPTKIKAKLRFEHFPFTGKLFELSQSPGPSTLYDSEYSHSGFTKTQFLLTAALIEHFGGNVTQVLMQMYPYPAYTDDQFASSAAAFIPFTIFLSFMWNSLAMVKAVAVEKEKQLKESMKMMGLPNWLHWSAWFLKNFLCLLLIMIIIVVLMKVSWYRKLNHSIITNTSGFILFLFLVLYACAIITSCFMLSVFFKRATIAMMVAAVFWLVAILPSSLGTYEKKSLAGKIFGSLLHNSAMSYGFTVISMAEGQQSGATRLRDYSRRHIFMIKFHCLFSGIYLSNLWRAPVQTDNISLGVIFVMLVIDTILYMLIALYWEAVHPGEFGVAKPWHFPCTSLFCCHNPVYTGEEVAADMPVEKSEASEFFESEPKKLGAGIQIQHLRKVYGHVEAVSNLTLNMYEDQITVLLGHNGAGKTTTMSMLTGLFPPTSGTAYISGYSIRSDMESIRDHLGFCPQQDILFDELTVTEHFYFYSRVKGIHRKEVQMEIDKYIRIMGLEDKCKVRSKKLSGGMKRKLCVGIALCGGSKVVMLDEPSSGMDPSARRSLWDLIRDQKKGRTILLTTHFMDEADLLGDRIAIMSEGRLVCCGSSFFLKKKYGAGYHLILEKRSNCDPEDVTALLARYIPDIKVEHNVGTELSYCISGEYSSVFQTMLRELESQTDRLGIESFGLSLTTMEEVFLKTSSVGEGRKEMPEKSSDDQEQLSIHTEYTTMKGCALIRNQLLAMFLKRIWYTKSCWLYLVAQILLVIICCVLLGFLMLEVNKLRTSEKPERFFSLNDYADPETLINGSNSFKEKYLEVLARDNNKFTDLKGDDLSDVVLEKSRKDPATVRQRYIVGATFYENDTIKAWYNSEPCHAAPLALSLALAAVVNVHLDPQHKFIISNFPLPDLVQQQDTEDTHMVMIFASYFILVSVLLSSGIFLIFYVKERAVASKHLQYLAGANVFIFWLAAFVWDMVLSLVLSLCVLVTIICFQQTGFAYEGQFGRLLLLLICFAYYRLPVLYLFSLWFKSPTCAMLVAFIVDYIMGTMICNTIFLLLLNEKSLTRPNVIQNLNLIFLISPGYSLASGVLDVLVIHSSMADCRKEIAECVSDNDMAGGSLADCEKIICEMSPLCCNYKTPNFYKWKRLGIGANIVTSLVYGTLLFVLLFMIECNLFKRLSYRLCNKKIPEKLLDKRPSDSDVLNEYETVDNLEKENVSAHALVLKNVSKKYRNLVAVRNISLRVDHYECFGLLGENGAGKTTTFKMMTGETLITYGDIWVDGFKLKTDLKKAQRTIGYCPQFDGLLGSLTGRENLMIFGMLRGVSYRKSKLIAEQLSNDLDFNKHLNKKVSKYSGGNRRKLSTAAALIGDPPLLFLDEPTTGMDPGAKRIFWDVICKVRDRGKCIILTSHSMEECEALCTRLVIMVNGSFKCIGSLQHLKSKFSEGFTLTIKLRKASDESETVDVGPIEKFVEENFGGAQLMEVHEELLKYRINDAGMRWSEMFGLMEKAKKEFPIEDYAIGQCSLEQVFLMFTKHQK